MFCGLFPGYNVNFKDRGHNIVRLVYLCLVTCTNTFIYLFIHHIYLGPLQVSSYCSFRSSIARDAGQRLEPGHATQQADAPLYDLRCSLHINVTFAFLCPTVSTFESLKVLSSEMDPAEIRLIRKDFIKGIVASGL
jgi:hypothetical protein